MEVDAPEPPAIEEPAACRRRAQPFWLKRLATLEVGEPDGDDRGTSVAASSREGIRSGSCLVGPSSWEDKVMSESVAAIATP